MPSQRSPEKEIVGAYIPRSLSMRVRKLARQRGVTLTTIMEELLTNATAKIQLTPVECEKIAADTKRAALLSPRKRTQRKNS